jgi:hypothetical protein
MMTTRREKEDEEKGLVYEFEQHRPLISQDDDDEREKVGR